jgi:hypothetical protein
MKSLSEVEAAIARFDQQLVPIANRPVDITDPDWLEKLKRIPPALDEAAIRDQVETFLAEVLDTYPQSDEAARAALRDLFHEYQAFSWAAVLPRDLTPDGFRCQLLLFSLKDQGRDTRDAILWLQDICREARSAGVELKPILDDVGGLSSEINRFGMGSTKDLLLKAR